MLSPTRKRRWVVKLAYFMDAVPRYLHRWRYPVAVLGVVAGLASYWLVERKPALASLIALTSLAGWAVLMVEVVLLSLFRKNRYIQAGQGVLQLTMQAIHQESLFFVLTFALLTVRELSAQVIFVGLIVLMTVISSIDPLYHLSLAPSRRRLFVFHAITLFFSCFLALPMAFSVPIDAAFDYAIAATWVATVPLLLTTYSGGWFKRSAMAVLATVLIVGCLWITRPWLPPMSAYVRHSAVTSELDEQAKAPLHSLQRVSAEQLTNQGLYAYTAIAAPTGLNQGIEHRWYLNGQLVDAIPMEITGGREEGFRAWSHKLNFPSNPEGRWVVKVTTPGGLVLGSVRFVVD